MYQSFRKLFKGVNTLICIMNKKIILPISLILLVSFAVLVSAQTSHTYAEEKPAIVFDFYESSSLCSFGDDYPGWNELRCEPIEGVEVSIYDENSQTLLVSGLTDGNGEVFFYSDDLPKRFNAYYKKEGYYTDKAPNEIANQYGTIRFFTTTLIKYAPEGYGHAEISLYDAKTEQPLKIEEEYLKGKGIAYVYLYDSNGNFVGQRDLVGMEPIATYDKLPVGIYEYYASASGYENAPRTQIQITKDTTTESKAFLKKYEENRFLRFLKKLFGFG